MDRPTSGLMRCHRGHSTPADKTFCESCGASLHEWVPPATDSTDTSADVVPTRQPRLSLRRIRRG